MPKKPIAIDPEVINREGETQVVSDSGLTIQCYSVYLWVVEACCLALATTLLNVLAPESLMPAKSTPASRAGAIPKAT